MLKRIMAFVLAVCTILSLAACKKSSDKGTVSNGDDSNQNTVLDYEQQEFEITGLWAPRQITEEAFKQYKDAGFNVMSFTNHDDQPRTSENQYYLGSKRTKEALEICKKIGIDVYISYGASWFNRDNEGDAYFDDKPFSTHNYYGEYMDIIKGVHINDEPTKETMATLAKDDLINDYINVYGNRKYMINLIPATAVASRNFADYDEMLKIYGETIMSKFENPYICVDVYPFSNSKSPEQMIIYNYNEIAKTAKKYGAETSFILQSSTGNEFLDTLSESDMRLQAYLAIAFGADNLQYYCYSVPEGIPYNHCMLERDQKTPNQLYYDIKTVNNEIQKFASAVLAYDWSQSIGISGTVDQTFRVSSIEYDKDFNVVTKFDTGKNYVSAEATYDLVVSQFTSEKYGEAYMFVNFGRENEENNMVNEVNVKFKDCTSVAIYGGKDYSGEPKIIELDKDGNFKLDLVYGDGAFVVPLK